MLLALSSAAATGPPWTCVDVATPEATASPVEPARGGCGGSAAYLLVFLLRRRR